MIVDILVLVVLLISALIAFLRGCIREVLTIMGVVGGLVAAYFGGPLLVPHMRGWFGVREGEEPGRLFDVVPYDIVADALSYGTIFIAVVVVLSIASHFLAEGARNLGLGAVDRTLGFIFGLVRGVFLLGFLYLPVHFFIDQDTKDAWFSGSRTHFYLEKTAMTLAEFIPSSAVEEAGKGIDEVSGTRKKLEDINLLKKGGNSDKNDTDQPVGTDSGSEGAAKQGYTEEFRQQMDELFQQKGAGPDEDRP